MVITRNDYMYGSKDHKDYYGQFVTEDLKNVVKSYIGIEDLKNSTDESFNDIKLIRWDNLPVWNNIDKQLFREALERNDAMPSLAELVCIAKAAAREIKKEF